jgi:uncharacterized lipoprotein YajG
MTRIIITGCVFAASLLLAACETTDTASNKPPAQSDQNPAHHMHYPSSGY